MTSPPPGPRRPWSFRRKLALQVLLLPVLLFSIELLYRGWQSLRGAPYGSGETLESMQGIAASLEGSLDSATAEKDQPEDKTLVQVFLHPFLGWSPDNFRIRFTEDVPYFQEKSALTNYDVMIVGGSVAARMCQASAITLVELLEADPRLGGRQVHLLMYPTGGYKQPQQLNLVTYALDLGIKPDAVINIDGFNELALSNYNALHASHPLHPSLSHWGHLIQGGALDRESLDYLVSMREAQRNARGLADLARDWKLTESAVLGSFALSSIQRLRGKYTQSYGLYVDHLGKSTESPTRHGPEYSPELKDVLETSVRNWRESSRSLSAVCSARGIYYVHVLQPTLHDQGSKPLSDAELATSAGQDGWVDAIREGYPRLRRSGAKLLAEGVHFVDCSMLFESVRDDLYVDACHFNEAGSDMLVREISKAFLAGMP